MPESVRTLRLALTAAATPEHVRDVADLFAASLRAINPLLDEGVTLVVTNYALCAELRGQSLDGADAVKHLEELVSNPTKAIQQHPELMEAALTLATKSERLVQYEARFFSGTNELCRIDDVFVRTTRAAGQRAMPMAEGVPSGETVMHSRILRVGRQRESDPLKARIELWGAAKDVDVEPRVNEESLWDLAKTGAVARLRVQGAWTQSTDGVFYLRNPKVVSVDETFKRWRGEDLLAEVRGNAHLFSRSSFDRITRELEEQQED